MKNKMNDSDLCLNTLCVSFIRAIAIQYLFRNVMGEHNFFVNYGTLVKLCMNISVVVSPKLAK